MPNIGDIIAFEEGSMPQEEIPGFFQGLIDSGIVWSLQGAYGRIAVALIREGVCHG